MYACVCYSSVSYIHIQKHTDFLLRPRANRNDPHSYKKKKKNFFTGSTALFVCVSVCLTGWMTPASLWQWLCWRRAQPAVGLCVKHFDLVAVDFIVGVERTKTVRSSPKYKHFCPNDGGWMEISPTCWCALYRENKQRMLTCSRETVCNPI